MEVIKIVGTDDTPSVTLDVTNEIFEISGRSLPEDVAAFYEPILDWIERYSRITSYNVCYTKLLRYLFGMPAVPADRKYIPCSYC